MAKHHLQLAAGKTRAEAEITGLKGRVEQFDAEIARLTGKMEDDEGKFLQERAKLGEALDSAFHAIQDLLGDWMLERSARCGVASLAAATRQELLALQRRQPSGMDGESLTSASPTAAARPLPS